jgi:hypothetical protein
MHFAISRRVILQANLLAAVIETVSIAVNHLGLHFWISTVLCSMLRRSF